MKESLTVQRRRQRIFDRLKYLFVTCGYKKAEKHDMFPMKMMEKKRIEKEVLYREMSGKIGKNVREQRKKVY
jgi:hypothetical protein